MAKIYIESNVLEYNNIKNIFGYNAVITGENSNTFYNKEFRYSSDNILWSDYKELTNKNLTKVPIYNNKVYIQYRFTKIGTDELSVESISLDVDFVKDEGGIPNCYWETYKSANRYTPQIIFADNGTNQNLFNPYAVGNSYVFYNQLSTLVSNMFGFCVLYFKTEPNAKSRDVVLKEYSIEHVVDKQNIKILVPDNQLPSKEIQFTTMMMDYPQQFEIHIVKTEFWKIFGQDSYPSPHDYLYMQQYMNRMYMVDSVSEPDDFGYQGTYWRVSLVPYQEMSSLDYDNENLLEDTESIIFSAEGKFKDEIEDEYADIRKDNQYNDTGDWLEGQDGLRRLLNPNMRIVEEKIYNDWTIVARQYYDLSYTVVKKDIANEYSYTTGFSNNDERMISFIFKPKNTTKNVSKPILIDKIQEIKGGIRMKLKSWSNLIEVGNYVKVSRTSDFNGLSKITKVNKGLLTIDIDAKFTEKTKLLSCAKLVVYETNEILNIRNDEKTMFEFTQMDNELIINLNGHQKNYSFEGLKKFEDKWYVMLLGMYRGLSNIWLYELDGSQKFENQHSKMKFIGKASNDLGEFDFGKTCYYDIMGCNVQLTNFRLWSKLCEEDTIELILSQYIVDDTHNTLIVDNAQNELLLNNKWS